MKPITTLSFLAGILCAVCLSACNKGDSIIIHTKEYSNEFNRVAVIKVRESMYINHAEVTDTVLKSRFMKSSSYFNLDKIPLEPNYRMIFISPDSVSFSTGYGHYSFKHTGNQFVFYSKPNAAARPNNDSTTFAFVKYKSSLTPFQQTPQIMAYRYTDIRTGYGDNKEIMLPVISYKLSRRKSPNSLSTYYGWCNNDFDDSFIATLGTQDTLAIQIFNYDMKASFKQ